MNKLYATQVALVAVIILNPVSTFADTWEQPINDPSRFTVLPAFNNQAVLDQETGLVWERSPATSVRDWSNAHRHCNGRVVGNRLGWRLPTVQELASLIDRTVPPPSPTLPAGHPFSNVNTAPGSFYWSASTSTAPSLAPIAYVVDFRAGSVGELNEGNPMFSWCVRGGQGVDTHGETLPH